MIRKTIYGSTKASRLSWNAFCQSSRQGEFDGPEYSREELEERRQGRQDHSDSLDRIETKREEE